MNQKQENELEALMPKAAAEPAYHPEFLRVLLESEVYVISDSGQADKGHGYLTDGDSLSVLAVPVDDNTQIIPFFSSLDELASYVDFEAKWVGINARHLFILTMGAILVLNPSGKIPKVFKPQEIKTLLSSGVERAFTQTTSPSDDDVRIDPPNPFPSKMVDSLVLFFATRPEVKAACVAMKQGPDEDHSHLLVAIDAEGDIKEIIQQAGSIALETLPGNQSEISFININNIPAEIAGQLSRRGKLFYEKRWGARLSERIGRA
jgi:hypothetical protein